MSKPYPRKKIYRKNGIAVENSKTIAVAVPDWLHSHIKTQALIEETTMSKLVLFHLMEAYKDVKRSNRTPKDHLSDWMTTLVEGDE